MWGLKKVSVRRSDALTHVSWQELESLLAKHYRAQGYEVEHCGTGRGGSRFDGGIDLRMRRASEYVLVQAKHWNARQVPHNAVHELLGLMVNEGATGAVLVTSGEFTRAAVEAATRHGHVQLIEGEYLRTMLGEWTRAYPTSSPAIDPDARSRRRAMSVSRNVGERLLNAAEDGLRSGAPVRHARDAASNALKAMLIKFAMATALFAVLAIGGSYAIAKIFSSMAAGVSRPAPEPMAPTEQVPVQAATYRPVVSGPVALDPTPEPGPTAAEIREQQRRAEEAMKVIEANTPEM